MAITTTASPQFAQTVEALIKAEIVANLRTGLPHLPREVMVISQLLSRAPATARATPVPLRRLQGPRRRTRPTSSRA